MMKSKDCSVATALILNGYLRAGEGEHHGDKAGEDRLLADAVRAIRQECDDWAENLSSGDSALEPNAITVALLEANGGAVSHSPYNLVSAALSLMSEAVDLIGPEVAMADLQKRLQAPVPRAPSPQPVPRHQQINALVESANDLAARIDAETEKPKALLTAWEVVCADLRARGVAVEERVTAPQNW